MFAHHGQCCNTVRPRALELNEVFKFIREICPKTIDGFRCSSGTCASCSGRSLLNRSLCTGAAQNTSAAIQENLIGIAMAP